MYTTIGTYYSFLGDCFLSWLDWKIFGLSVSISFTSSSLMVYNFAACGIPFLAGFYSKAFILEVFSVRYVNIFGFFNYLCLRA
jgi:formate hydrogenlyase subunit 3/multisubunit Na+/H+ antiporter MnhD subunit